MVLEAKWDLITYSATMTEEKLMTKLVEIVHHMEWLKSGTCQAQESTTKTQCTRKDALHVEEELFVSDKTECIAKIIDDKYKPVYLKELTNNLTHQNDNQKEQLHPLLDRWCGICDGTLGLWKGSLYKIELQDDAKTHHTRLYGIPHAYKQNFEQEVEWLCKVGVLRKVNRSEWVAPTF